MEGSQKVTTSQACRDLRVSWHTLNLWMRKLGIEHEHHPLELRLRMIATADVERIRQARAEVLILRPHARTSVPLPRVDVQSPISHTKPPESPRSAPQRHAAENGTSEGLPDGLMVVRKWAREHGLAENTVLKQIDRGKVTGVRGDWWVDGHNVKVAIGAEGHAEGYAFWSHREDFNRCPDCPSPATSAARESVPTVNRA